jgi:RNA 3'-terminal phosphate cyclase (ATP)
VAVDPYLGDQLILPLSLATGESVFTTATASSHLLTNIQVVQHFLNASIRVEQSAGRAMITVRGDGFHV